MEATFPVSLEGDSLAGGLDGLSARLGDMTEVMASAASVMWASVEANFADGGRPEAWATLDEKTVERKGHAIPLYETGRLRYDIDGSHGPLHATLTAHTPYAGLHQYGTSYTPARPFMLIQPEDTAFIRDMVAAHITAA